MKNMILCLAVAVLLSGCAGVIEKQQPVCTGTALVGGQESSVQIYGVRKQNNQTQYRAGYPFTTRTSAPGRRSPPPQQTRTSPSPSTAYA
ncbi:phage exclusion lipoprotein Cor [Enterobacter hormaechei]